MKTIPKILIYFISLFLLIMAAYINKEIYLPTGTAETSTIVKISTGMRAKEIAQLLKTDKLIDNAHIFVIYTYLKGSHNKLHAGEYFLSAGLSMSQIVNIIANGETTQKKITLIEGWDLRDIAAYFEKQNISSQEELYKITGEPTKTDDNAFNYKYSVLEDKPQGISLEGYVYPDTYYIGLDDTAETIIGKAISNLDQKLTPALRQEIVKQDKSIYQIITMASIIEKEVKTSTDKQIVSGILWKRFNAGMGLQVDATVLYALGSENSKVYTNDTKVNSPYNTYRYKGLPAGPICNPSIDSIIAAIYPTKTDYWYYLSAPDGTTIYSKNLEEHNLNKAKYLK